MNLAERVWPYREVDFHEDETGYVVWRPGTGRNVELLHIHTEERGKGHGRRLVYRMLDRLRDDPPYHSVFGFSRASNEEAHAFYVALGFQVQTVKGVYQDGRAVLFWGEYRSLVKRMEEWKRANP